MLNPTRDNDEGIGGGRDDTYDRALSRRSLRSPHYGTRLRFYRDKT